MGKPLWRKALQREETEEKTRGWGDEEVAEAVQQVCRGESWSSDSAE